MEKVTKEEYLEYLDAMKDEMLKMLKEDFPDTYEQILKEVFEK